MSFVETDVSDAEAVRRFVERVATAFGGVHVLVNNAGVSSPRSLVHDLAEAEWHRVLGVNLHGHFYATKYAVPHILRAGGGAIVNTASVLGQATLPGGVAYTTSKAALIGMTRSLAREVGEYGICVNAIAPGLVEHEGQNVPRALTELQLKERSIKRLETPEDLMGTLVFLCSSDSDFMTGQAIVVDGGSVFH